MNKIEKARNLLNQAFKTLDENRFASVKQQIRTTLNHLDEAEKKKHKTVQNQKTAAETWKNQIAKAAQSNVSTEAAMKTLKYLDQMIENNKKKPEFKEEPPKTLLD